MMNRTAWCLGLLAVLAAACSKQEPPARTAPADPPGPTASAASATALSPVTGDPTAQLLQVAVDMARDLAPVAELSGKFAGYDSVEAIARKTDAQSNFQWVDFASMVSGSMKGPVGYRSALGEFIAVQGTTPDRREIGLVVNLANQKVSMYPVGAYEITPAGDALANAVAVVLEVDGKVRQRMPGAAPADIRSNTIANLTRAVGGNPLASSAASAEGPFADVASAQQEAIRKETARHDARALGPMRSAEMEKRVIAALYAVFEDAKKSGLKLADPQPLINATNVGRRNTGVWELVVEPYGADPRFVVTRDLTTPAGMFALEGLGGISTSAFVRDPGFESTGQFAEGCMYEVFLRNRSVKFPCMAFLEGKHDRDLRVAMRDMVIAEVKDAAGRADH